MENEIREIRLRNRTVIGGTARDVQNGSTSNKSTTAATRLDRLRRLHDLQRTLEEKEREREQVEIERLRRELELEEEVEEENNSRIGSINAHVSQRTGEWVNQLAKDRNERDDDCSIYISQEGSRKSSTHDWQPTRDNELTPRNDIKYTPRPTRMTDTREHDLPQQNCIRPTMTDNTVDEIKGLLARKKVAYELPIFEGDPAQWPLFFNMFTRSTNIGHYTDDENLLRLQKALKGSARDCVGALLHLPGGLPKIMDRLKRRYGTPDTIMREVMAKLGKISGMGEKGLNGLDEIACEVDNAVVTAISTNRTEYLFNPSILNILVDKLNVYLKLQWGEFVADLGNGPISLEIFNDWVQSKVVALGHAGGWKINERSTTINLPECGSINPVTTQVREEQRMKTIKNCSLCSTTLHGLEDCNKFQKMTEQEKIKWARDQRLCFVCLKRGHTGFACRSRIICQKCKRRHNTLLHPTVTQNVAIHEENEMKHNSITNGERSDEEEIATSAVNFTREGKILLRIVPVTIHGPKKSLETFAFLDSGSTVTMIREDVALDIGLTGTKRPLRIKWSDETVRNEENSCAVNVRISGQQKGAKQLVMYNARTVHKLSLPIQSVVRDTLGIACKKLIDLEIKDYQNAHPTILIGEDNWPLTVPLKVVHGPWNGPVATKTRLGWVVHGKLPVQLRGRIKDGEEEVHQMCQWEEEQEKTKSEAFLHELVASYIRQDGVMETVDKNKETEDNEIQARRIFYDTTKRINRLGDRWETGLLWKGEFPKLDTRTTALKRLWSLERRMDRDPAFGERYVAKMEENIEKRYVSRLSEDELNRELGYNWYLPHLGVINPNKPTKLRICFDAAAKTDGVCLNDLLLTGPDLLVSLAGLLCRFREFPIAIGGDIKEMYPQIVIRKEDQMAQRFLWRGRERTKPPNEYAVRVMTFGAKCSPFSAQEVKNKNAQEFKEEYPETVKAIVENHYMDDYLDSIASVSEANRRVQEVRKIHQKGGFIMCNWTSNAVQVLENIPVELRAVKDLRLHLKDCEAEKLLGLLWMADTDLFKFNIKLERVPRDVLLGQREPTRREVLRCVMSVFDPMGFIALVIIQGKVLLQEIYKDNASWDEEIGKTVGRKWRQWLEKLKKVETLKIPRCFGTGLHDAEMIQLHIMCDASERAYAAVAYMRVLKRSGIEVTLAAAKARVAPIGKKYTTIPKLELQAAVTATRVATFLKKEHRVNLEKVIFWCDSRIVLGWIRSRGKQLPTYIKRRVEEIWKVATPEAWRWVPTNENCADDATRAKNEVQLTSRWFQGPPFLKKAEAEWPFETETVADQEIDVQFVGVIHETEWELLPNINNISRWHILLRTTAWVPRIAKYFKTRDIRWKQELMVEELNWAEEIWLRRAQADSFTEEIDSIRQEKPISINSRLISLNPFIDERGLLRVGSRIMEAEELGYDTKFPIILAPEHRMTQLLLQNFHRWAKQLVMYNARTVHKLSLPIQSVVRDTLGIACKKLIDLEIKDYQNAHPTILIGEDNWPLTVPLKVVHGPWNGPVATKTRLGWVVHGKLPVQLRALFISDL